MSSALFGNAARATSKNFVEFRAGKMHLKGKIVHADKRKGLVYLYQADDSLMHFCWKDRNSGLVEEDLIIFPDDCEYRRVPACTTGRVFVLKFRSTTRRLFFWMQEPKTDKDEEYCRKINELLNNPPTPGSHSTPSRSGVSGGSGSNSSSNAAANAMLGNELSNLRDSDLQNIIGNISQQQLMQILGSGVPNLSSLLAPNSSSRSSATTVTPAPTTASTPTTAITPPPVSSTATPTTAANTTTTTTAVATPMETSSSSGNKDSSSSSSTAAKSSSSGGGGGKEGPIQLADLQSILSGMMNQDAAADESTEGAPGVDLSPALTAEALQPILSNPEFVEKLKPYLPPTSDPLPTSEQLKGTVTSPQFKQAVTIFSHALQSGQLGPLINQFGLGEDAVLAAASADMEAFVKALDKNSKSSAAKDMKKKEEEGSAGGADNKKEASKDDDNMAVD